MREINERLLEYGENHKNRANRMIQFISVPVLFWSIIALLWCIPSPAFLERASLNWAYLALMLALGWYMFMSTSLAIGMLLLSYLAVFITQKMEEVLFNPLIYYALIVFFIALFVQTTGYLLEKKKPNLKKFFAFVLIAPLWFLSFIYRALGIKIN